MTALIALALAIVAVVVFLMMGSVDDTDEFQAYDGPGDAVEVPDTGLAVPAVTAMKRAADDPDDAPHDVPREPEKAPGRDDAPEKPEEGEPRYPAVDGTEDTLNRTGPAPKPSDADAPKGSLDRETIQRGIRAVTPMVKVCYEETLKDFPDAEGKITVGFRIIGEQGKGRVEMSELDQERTTLFDEKLHDCMLTTVGDAEFEAPEGGGVVNVRYPFVFETDAEHPPEDP